MKKVTLYIVLISIQFICVTAYTQNNESYFSNTEKISLDYRDLGSHTISNTNSSTSIEQIAINTNLNSIILKQVGLYNVSEISQSKQTHQEVIQLGNKNFYSFLDYRNSSPVNLHILQQGNANSLQIYGSNSIINGMKITQKSNFKNIVIKNYK